MCSWQAFYKIYVIRTACVLCQFVYITSNCNSQWFLAFSSPQHWNFPNVRDLVFLPHMARFSFKKPNKILYRKTVTAILKTGIIVICVDEHCSEETDLICNFVVAPSHVLVNSTWFVMLDFKFLLSLRYFFVSTDISVLLS